MQPAPAPLLTIRDLSIRIEGRSILRCEEFVLRPRDKILLTSRSGGGKSVFLRCLAGLLPLHVVEGGAFSRGDGGPVMTYQQYAQARASLSAMSFVFQDAYNALHPFRPVSKQLREGRPGEADQTLASDLDRFRLKDLDLLGPDRFRDRLSGGQCQRISLLLAADLKREVVLLDEPLTDVDAFSRASIEDLLIERLFNRESSKTVILVSHGAYWLKRLDGDFIRHLAIEQGADDHAFPQLTELLGSRKLNLSVKHLPPARSKTALADTAHYPAQSSQDAEVASGPPDVPVLSLRIDRRISPGGKANEGFQLWPMSGTGELAQGIELRRGEGVALYGLSGSGKSFLLRCMAGLWSKSIMKAVSRRGQHDAAQGASTIDLGTFTPDLLASNIQYIFQNNRGSVSLSDTLDADLAMLKKLAVESTLRLLKRYPVTGWSIRGSAAPKLDRDHIDAFMETMIAELWERLHIPTAPLRDRSRFRLSGLSLGMLRRYTLIRALLKLDLHTAWQSRVMESAFEGAPWQVRYKPRILLADEVSRGLDSESLFELGHLIQELKSTAKLSVVVVSHENAFTAALAERIYLVVDGFVMPTALAPNRSEERVQSDGHAFVPTPGLMNSIYGLYCPDAAASFTPEQTTTGGSAMLAPDTLTKLTGRSSAGCIVDGMLRCAGGGAGMGCPSLGKDGCTHDNLRNAGDYGVCC